jgi:hypothetical protein
MLIRLLGAVVLPAPNADPGIMAGIAIDAPVAQRNARLEIWELVVGFIGILLKWSVTATYYPFLRRISSLNPTPVS